MMRDKPLHNISDDDRPAAGVYLLSALVVMTVAVLLAYVVLSLPPIAPGLTDHVAAKMEHSGVSNPVTAVLLNFRGYDTLLEMVVLLVALLGVWALGDPVQHHETTPGPVLDTLARVSTPVLILVAAYLLWVGAHAPGGAFQAGSVLGAAGVLLVLTGWRPRGAFMDFPLRLILIIGPATFVAMAAITLLIAGQLLTYPVMQAGTLILILETAAMLTIGVTLAALFLGGSPSDIHKQ